MELVKSLKPGGILILSEGDFEWYKENQMDFAVPADPNCSQPVQPGKTWLAHNAYGAHRGRFPKSYGLYNNHIQ
jgi:hypothetical protein